MHDSRTIPHPRAAASAASRLSFSRLHVFDGSSRIVIEAHDQDDALCLCTEIGWVAYLRVRGLTRPVESSTLAPDRRRRLPLG